ncbi:MAG TPA: hypothetical protein PKA87_07605 [Microthrixaceae bacterium]|nr:hypothetical protein [Microthrixaceae bacterium]MCB9402784.1 hypothetical protein [Microthrixaceae bacterium]MCO5307247.1 DNA repair-scaffolding-like protein [Microthrixaceae bacterium]HMX07388.1 hypothetical protein [Microthrixaceae bacterium]HMY88156.1 hypothetical protein [Microthrixaceae bacterium]
MPVERRSGSQQTRSAIIAVVALVIAVLGAWGMIRLASGGQGPVKVQLGDDTFDAGYATRMADQIDKDGPLLFSDVSGRGQRQPIYVVHIGSDDKDGWFALSAIAPGAAEGCFVTWNPESELFEERRAADPAEGRDALGERCRDVTWSADGTDGSDGSELEAFPWEIDKDERLIIDLRPDQSRTTTTTIATSGN